MWSKYVCCAFLVLCFPCVVLCCGCVMVWRGVAGRGGVCCSVFCVALCCVVLCGVAWRWCMAGVGSDLRDVSVVACKPWRWRKLM